MKKQLSLFLALAILFSLAAPCALAAENPTPKVTHLYAFGDSSIDTGRGRALTTQVVSAENPPDGAYIKAEEGYYWNGRYSNGKVFVEHLAEHLGVSLTNYAVGGAKSGPDATGNTNWSSWLPGTGGIEQTREFVDKQGGRADPDALYLISIGGNDTYNLNLPGATVEAVTAQSAANIRQMVADLAQAGAKNFIVMLQTRRPGKTETAFLSGHRAATLAAMEEAGKTLGVNIACVDTQPLNDAIEQDMTAYGYKTLSYYMHSDWVPAIGYNYHYLDNTSFFKNPPAAYGAYAYDGFKGYDEGGLWSADQYYFYDEYHVTRTTHRHIYNYIQPIVDRFLGMRGEADPAPIPVSPADPAAPVAVVDTAGMATPVGHIYAFGDSSIDTGRGRALTTQVVGGETPPKGAYIKAEEGYYWNGRYSNGKTSVELLAEHLGVGLTNYAVGGAKSGPDATGNSNWSSWLPGTGGMEQTREFLDKQGGKADPDGLYFISIGGNDTYNLNLPGATVEEVTAQSAANIRQMVGDLAQAGAKNFIVMLQARKPGKAESAFQTGHRTATLAAMEEARRTLGVHILTVDIAPMVGAVESDPAAYGYKTLSYYMHSDWVPAIGYNYHYLDNSVFFKDPPAGYGAYSYDSFQGYDQDGLWNADQYYCYDEYHVTRTTHRHIYEFMQPLVDAFLCVGTAALQPVRPQPEAPIQPELPQPPAQPERSPVAYTVVKGDSLWSIAQKQLGSGSLWKLIYETNRTVIRDPQIILPGMSLIIPGT